MTRTIQLRRPAASASDDEEHRLLRAARRRSGTSQPRCVSWAVPAQCDAQTSRRQRVARSWCGAEPAYGALNDGMRHQTGASAATPNAQVQSPQTGAAAALSLGLPPQPTSIATSPVPQKRKTARNRMDFIMPSLRSLVSRRTASGSTSSLHQAGQESKTPMIVVDSGFMRKCDTAPLALSTASSRTTLLAEPLQAINRLRVTPAGSARSLCSRCSSLLSLQASGSRYSLHASTAAFVQCPVSTVLCKLCLTDVVASDVCTLRQCSCMFCKQCMQAYVSFEITEGAYDISCPDAQCPAQGVLVPSEIEQLVDSDLVLKHNKYRLNREVDIDKFRTWCPKAGCETVCNLCPTERCSPQSIHCPTCTSQFCSNCKRNWHDGTTCEEQARLSGADSPLGIPFDSDLIKCCPMCSVPIEKDEGCAQMMCKRCKHVFCWYCLASLDDDFLLRHYDKGPCKNKLGHSRASVIWHRTQVIGIFAGFGILLLVASPLLLLAAPCIVCCKCRICSGQTKLDNEEELAIDESAS